MTITAQTNTPPIREVASEGRLGFRFTPADRANVARVQARARAAHGLSLSTSQAIRAGLVLAARDTDAACRAIPAVHGGRPKGPLAANPVRGRAHP
jgi:hypothetical protein